MATAPANRGPTISDDRPAAAAAASKWPRFDFIDVHCTVFPFETLQRARTAAPTYKMPIVIESTTNRNIPRSDRPEQFQCRVPRGSSCPCYRIAHSRSIASETTHLAPSSSRSGRPAAQRTRALPRQPMLSIGGETHRSPRRGSSRPPAGRTCGSVRELKSCRRSRLRNSQPH